MISTLNGVTPAPFDLPACLNSDDEGQRLAAYAYLYPNPEPELTSQLVETIAKDNPFAQYWALRTLRRQLQVDPEALDRNGRRCLQELFADLDPGTDRAYELRQILRQASA